MDGWVVSQPEGPKPFVVAVDPDPDTGANERMSAYRYQITGFGDAVSNGRARSTTCANTVSCSSIASDRGMSGPIDRCATGRCLES